MLEKHRSLASPHLGRLASRFPNWTPDQLSWFAFGWFALGALVLALLRWASSWAWWWAPLLFFAAAVLVFAGGVFDALDGFVARARGLTSPRGDLLDHVLDRYADLLLLLGIAVSGWAQPVLALLALVSLLLVSYMGTQAQAVLGRRLYGGLLGRADRIVLVSGAALAYSFLLGYDQLVRAAWAIPVRFTVDGVGLTWWDLLLLFFALVGQGTAFWRARWTWRQLSPPGPGTTPGERPPGPT